MKIFFDVDGVLADFAGGVLKYTGYPVPELSVPNEQALMWERLRPTEHFFALLDPLPDGLRLFRKMQNLGYHVEILTATPSEKYGVLNCREDKEIWLKKMDIHCPINIVARADKQYFAKDHTHILIDDFKKNVREWNEAGGKGFLYPAEGLEEELMQYIASLS